MRYHVVHKDGSHFDVRNIYCVGRNYTGHAKELGNPLLKEPMYFQKSLTCLTLNERITLPSKRNIQHELELVLLIGKDGVKIKEKNAEEHMAGIGLGLDLTDRELQDDLKENRLPWFLSKSFQNSAIVSTFHDPDLNKWSQKYWLKMNGELVQQADKSEMQFSFSFLISYLSSRIPLLSGDIIYTGTPAGVGMIKDGDVAELGLGNEVVKVVRFSAN